MDGGGQLTQAFPRPGPALKAILALVVALGIGFALLIHWAPTFGSQLFELLDCKVDEVARHGQVWRLVTAGLLTSPTSLSHLIFTLIGLYFLSTDLERRWGSWRFVRFMLVATVVGFGLAVGLALVTPASIAILHPATMFGASAAMTATAIAWSKAHADMQVRLFFFLPVSGRALFWVTIGYCFLGLAYHETFSEGVVAPFGGVITGIALGAPRGGHSGLYTAYLRMKLAFLRRRAGHVGGMDEGLRDSETRPAPEAKRKRGGPPLRVVYGGLEDELKKRKPPKDKRYLN